MEEEAPIALHFSYNGIGWICSSQYINTDDDGITVHDKVKSVVDSMEEFGKKEQWSSNQYYKFFWPMMQRLEEARTEKSLGATYNLDPLALMHYSSERMEALELSTDRFRSQFPLLNESEESNI